VQLAGHAVFTFANAVRLRQACGQELAKGCTR